MVAKAVVIARVVVVAAAIVVKTPAAVAPKTAGPTADADQVAAPPKPPEAAAVAVALEPKPVVVSQKQNVDLAKTLAAAPRAPPARTMK